MFTGSIFVLTVLLQLYIILSDIHNYTFKKYLSVYQPNNVKPKKTESDTIICSVPMRNLSGYAT